LDTTGLEGENARLKKLLAEAMLDIEALKVVRSMERPDATDETRGGHGDEREDKTSPNAVPAVCCGDRELP
jgi:hypothetical protein